MDYALPLIAGTIAAMAANCLTYTKVLPRLPGFAGECKPLAAIIFAAIQAAVAVAVFVVIGSIALFLGIWIGIGGGASGLPGFFTFCFLLALSIVYLLTIGIVFMGSSTGAWKLQKNSAAHLGTATVVLVEVALSGLALYGASLVTAHDRLYSYVDKEGNYVLEKRYKEASGFVDGVAQVRLPFSPADRFTYVDKTGKEVPAPKDLTPYNRYRQTTMRLDDDPSRYEDDGNFSVGREVIKHGSLLMTPFSEGLAIARSETAYAGWGFVDKSFKFVIPETMFDDVRHFKEGLAPAAVTYDYEGRQEKPHGSGSVKKWGYIDRKGKWVIPPTYGAANSFSEGRAAVGMWINEGQQLRYGYIDRSGKLIIPIAYTVAQPFQEGLAAVCK